MRLAKLFVAAGLLLIGVGIPLLYAGWYGQLDWAFTPEGKARLYFLLLAATVAGLSWWGIHVHRADRAKARAAAEAREWAEIEEWEKAITGEWPAVRRITAAEMDAESDRMHDELRRTPALPVAVREWPQPWPGSQRLVDYAVAAPEPCPLPARMPLPTRPIAEVDTYLGSAAWFGNDMRAGVDPADEYYAAIARSLSRGEVVEGVEPVSPAPRHAWGRCPGTRTQRLDPRFTSWEESTGAWSVVSRELVGAS